MTQSFLALDDEQRAVAQAVTAAADFGVGPDLRAEWRQVTDLGERATSSYLCATSDVSEGANSGQTPIAATRQAEQHIAHAREAIRRFNTAHQRILDEASGLAATVPRLISEARSSLASARSAVNDAESAGYHSAKTAAVLAEAEQFGARTDPARHGLREAAANARSAAQLAQVAHAAAVDAPNLASRAGSALASVITRRAAAATKIDRVPQTMSVLRREFAAGCSADLEATAPRAAAALQEADRGLVLAHTHADAHAWDDLMDQITAIRSILARAETETDSVLDRLAQLRDVATDPARRVTEVKFSLRDAQHLVVARSQVARFGPGLDALVRRLESAQKLVKHAHPDYLRYLRELRAIQDEVADIVKLVRAAQP